MIRFVKGIVGVSLGAIAVLLLILAIDSGNGGSALQAADVEIPESSTGCVMCHSSLNPGIIDHWEGSGHAKEGIGCYECHSATEGEADAFNHNGYTISVVVTPLDCSRCHTTEFDEFTASHHAKAGNILASLDNFLAETVEGARMEFSPHSPTPGLDVGLINGFASAQNGCMQCHGSMVSLESTDGGVLSVADFAPDDSGMPTNMDAVAKIKRTDDGMPVFSAGTWPNTGIGRLNIDGSRGSCTACHSRHDFSRRRARQPENCGKCHLGPDHPQKEIYEESKHGIAYRDLKDDLNLNAENWVLGEDYSAAPTCATCHMSGHSRNGGKITHDIGERISWTNRPPVSTWLDTDENHSIVKETDPVKRAELVTDSGARKRERMVDVCTHCHSTSFVNGFYSQYDSLVLLYNEKFAKPGLKIMGALMDNGLRSKTGFDEEVEWTWFYLWHHEGRRARHGAAMMAPDYTHWHGMYEVAERFYMELIPQAREMAEEAIHNGNVEGGEAVLAVVADILARPEHIWFEEGAEGAMEAIRKQMEDRYGK